MEQCKRESGADEHYFDPFSIIHCSVSPSLHPTENKRWRFGKFLQDSRIVLTNVSLLFRSQEGSQYVRGFGGIGGMLRYTVDFQVHSSCMS
jgi:hypothetical protein